MYQLSPTRVYMLDAVRDDADAMARVSRMLGALGRDENEVAVFTRDEAYDVVRAIQAWPGDALADGVPPQRQRVLVFTKITIEGHEEDDPLVEDCPEDVPAGVLSPVLGHITLVRDTHSPESDRERNLVCWNTQDFGVMYGCPHGCQYCGLGKDAKMVVVGANIDEYMRKVVGPAIEKFPAQKCFRLLGWGADIITFEPEYGAFESFLVKLSEYEDRYGYFHTGSSNVDWVETVAHRDRLIGVWSMTADKVSELIEHAAPSPAERIEAARKCEAWGVPARFKFKPMIPVRGWREEYSRTIEQIFEQTRPESLGFCVIMWMNLDVLAGKIDLDLLDPEYVDAARAAADEMRDVRVGPFPHHVRAEIYRFLIQETRRWDAKVPLYISTESREMWEELQDELGQNPRTFICGCNPIETPGPTMMPSGNLCNSTYFDSQKEGAV